MRICRTLVALVLLVAAAAYANPPAHSVYTESVIGCADKNDAQQLAALAGANLDEAAQLLVWGMVKEKCDPYEGPFMVNRVIGHYGKLLVIEVVTFTDGLLYILYGDENGRWSI